MKFELSPSYNGWIDLFGFGTSGYNHGAVCYQPWSTSTTNRDYYAYGQYTYNSGEHLGEYDALKNAFVKAGKDLPINKNISVNGDLLLRHLDCAVIEYEHAINEMAKVKSFDSVRGVFVEGSDLFPDSGIKEKNHIQICVRNPNCIKGYFLPRMRDENYSNPE